jgi:3-mercaptopyruvate sulfurtransferase SseA
MGVDHMKSEDLKFVSTAWAAEHLTDDDLIIIDSQADSHDYIIEHLPGALDLVLMGFLLLSLLKKQLNHI